MYLTQHSPARPADHANTPRAVLVGMPSKVYHGTNVCNTVCTIKCRHNDAVVCSDAVERPAMHNCML